jgi:5-methylcytosine-specific restriction endonuclease McrA
LVVFDGSTTVETGTASVGGGRAAWRELDHQFRSLAKRRGALDHEELALIREAIEVQLWRELGMVSIREYLERRMGYTPGVASERVRVAEALDSMPALDDALASNELHYSAVREITRIATRRTERAWLAACRGKTMKEIAELLAEREPGDRPESPRKPDLRMKEKTLKYPPHVEAILRQCRAKLEREMGERVAEHEVLEAMGLAFLRGESTTSKTAPTQIAISVCPSCKVARQNGAGVDFAISQKTFERAACDAQWLGDVDGERARAVQDVTPATRTFVFARDKHRCRVPGCRSTQNIEVHHIVHREHGGSHEPSNLVCLCWGHHNAHHDGTLIIRGTADALEVIRLDEEPVDTFHLESPGEKMSEVAAFQMDAVLALKTLGLKKDIAAHAVRDALECDAPGDLEGLVKAALRRCYTQ